MNLIHQIECKRVALKPLESPLIVHILYIHLTSTCNKHLGGAVRHQSKC